MGWRQKTLLSLSILLLPTLGYSQQSKPKEDDLAISSPGQNTRDTEILTLQEAIERAQKNNLDFKQAKMSLEEAESSFKAARHTLFLPQIGITASAQSAWTVGQIPGDDADLIGESQHNRGYPTSSLNLGLLEYTLYNGGKDTLSFEIEKANYKRAKEIIEEQKRALKLQVSSLYHRVKTDAEKLDAAKRSAQMSGAIVKLIRSRLNRGFGSETDLESALIDLRTAQNNASSTAVVYQESLWRLNNLLGDPIGKNYVLKTSLVYKPFKLSYSEALKKYNTDAPTLKNVQTSEFISQKTYEAAQREQMPLPKVTISGILYGSDSSYSAGTFSSQSATHTGILGNPNIDVGVMVNLSLPLWGPTGFLNSRTIRSAEINLSRQKIESQKEVRFADVTIRGLLYSIRSQENNISNLEKSYKSSLQILDTLFAQFNSSSGRNISRIELRETLETARNTEIEYLEALLTHMDLKSQLAELIGLDPDQLGAI